MKELGPSDTVKRSFDKEVFLYVCQWASNCRFSWQGVLAVMELVLEEKPFNYDLAR